MMIYDRFIVKLLSASTIHYGDVWIQILPSCHYFCFHGDVEPLT